jgi:hypothetical protein
MRRFLIIALLIFIGLSFAAIADDKPKHNQKRLIPSAEQQAAMREAEQQITIAQANLNSARAYGDGVAHAIAVTLAGKNWQRTHKLIKDPDSGLWMLEELPPKAEAPSEANSKEGTKAKP